MATTEGETPPEGESVAPKETAPEGAPGPVAAGCYKLIHRSEKAKEYKGIKHEVVFVEVPGVEIPDEIKLVEYRINRVSVALKDLFDDDPDKLEVYFLELMGTAQRRLLGPKPQHLRCAADLNEFEEKVYASSSDAIKNRISKAILKIVGPYVAGFFLLLLLSVIPNETIGAVRTALRSTLAPGDGTGIQNWANLWVMVIVTIACVWLGEMVALQRATFTGLTTAVRELRSFSTKIGTAVFLTIILAVFAHLKVVGVVIAAFSSSDFDKNVYIASMFGVVCGLSHRGLWGVVVPHIDRLRAGMGKVAPEV